MRKFKLLLTLFFSAMLLMGGAGCTAKIKNAYHLKRGNGYFAAGQYDKAEIEYLNVLYHGPMNFQAVSRLGTIYFDEGRLPRSAPFIFRAHQLATNDLEMRLKLGMIYLAMGKPKEAQAEANFILARNPGSPDAPLLLVGAVRTPTDTQAAQEQLQKISHSADGASVEVALGMLALRAENTNAAAADFKRAKTLDSKFGPTYTALGALELRQNNLKAAESDFKSAAEFSPPRSPRKLEYAQFETQIGNVAEAQELLQQILKQTPDFVPAWIGMAEILLDEKKYDEAAKDAKEALRRDPDNFDAKLLNARLDLARGQTSSAVAELDRMSRDYPQVALVHYHLGLAYFMSGQPDAAATSLRKAISLNPKFTEAILLLAQIQIKNGNAAPAVASLERLVAREPQLVKAQLLLADAYRVQDDPGKAVAIYHQLEKSHPQDADVPLLLGAALLKEKDADGARKEFERALELSPGSLPALQEILDLDLSEKQFAAAEALVQKAIEKNPKQVVPRLLLARVYLARGDQEQAEGILKKTIELMPQAQEAYLLLAQLYVDAKENQQASALMNEAIEKDPKNISALLLLASMKTQDKAYKAAAAAYEKILLIDPKFSVALDNLAYLYSENLGQLDRAYELAQQARAALPFDPSTADTLGWILFRKGQYPSALSLLQEAASKLPNESEVQYHLGMARYMMTQEESARAAFQRALQSNLDFPGRAECEECLKVLAIDPKNANADARAFLEKRISEKKNDPIALQRLALIYQQDGALDKAIETYEALLQADPNNVMSRLNLARLYSTKDPQKAYNLAKDAYTLKPNDPDASYLFGHFAYLNGNYQLALSLLQQTTQNRPGDSKACYDLAKSAYSLGKIAEAQSAMQNALQAGLASPQSEEAKRFLDMLALSINPSQAIAAESRVAEILKAEPDYAPALMASAAINDQKKNIPAAEQACQKVLSQYPNFSPAQKQLAIMYAHDGDKTDQAYALAIKASGTFSDDPELSQALGMIVFQKGDYFRAANLLKTAIAEGKADAESYYYLGAAQYHLKQFAGSKASLQQALNLNLPEKLAANAKQMLAHPK
ncbi:MAG TPA: tetratricopeptide repeat protein [Verrucomicrobiae bacterium]|nr:tetratricopeptide repeat protein [Verrucomicrobiae bacterium]